MRGSVFQRAMSNIRTMTSGLKIPQRSTVALLALVLLLASATASARLWSRRYKKVVTPFITSALPLTAATQGNPRETTVGLPIQLKKLGFVPLEITRPAGDYQLSVSNQSGVSEISLSLEREHGARLHEGRLNKERLRWRQNVRLTPGTYLLTEASHPDWVCRIVISSR